jgi:uncharacterized protein (DUF4415 family)
VLTAPISAKSENKKQLLTVRYAAVVAAFTATGKSRQPQMNYALRDWLKTHSPQDYN